MAEADNWDIFEDRAKSLLERWSKFRKRHPESTAQHAIEGFLSEINDNYTKGLLKPDCSECICKECISNIKMSEKGYCVPCGDCRRPVIAGTCAINGPIKELVEKDHPML
jgi:hypothetical protein